MKNVTMAVLAGFILVLISSCQPATEEPQSISPSSNDVPAEAAGQPFPEEPATNNLSLGELNFTTPQDILDEVAFYAGLGGGGEGCSGADTSPIFYAGTNDDKAQLLDKIQIVLCGLPVTGENVKIRVKLPNNSYREYTEQVDSGRGIYFDYESELNDPTGTYQFAFEGGTWSIDKNIVISDISTPSLFWDGNQLIFAKFQPNENIRLFVYSDDGSNAKLVGWQAVKVNSEGQLIVNLNDPKGQFVAIGEISGEVPFQWKWGMGGWSWYPISK